MGRPIGKLGKLPPRHDPRTLKLARYLTADLPANPPKIDWGKKATNLGMMGNDVLGDCAWAAPGHAIQLWTAENDSQVILPDAAIIKAYGSTGYIIDHPETDRGTILLDMLNFWRTTPGIGGHTIKFYLSVDFLNDEHIKTAMNLGGGLIVGVNLPKSIQDQDDLWHVALGDDNTSLGGHALWLDAYDFSGEEHPTGIIEAITWGRRQKLTIDWLRARCDEAWVAFSSDWAGPNGAPNGIAFDALSNDLLQATL